MTTGTPTTLEAVQNKIANVAKMYCNGDTDIVDEIVARTNLYIIENGKQNETEAYILQQARWQASDYFDKSKAYTKYVGSIEATVSTDTDEELDWNELVADEAPSPEELLARSEYAADFAQAIESLTPEQQTIVTLLAKGFSCSEIAAKFGKSRVAISQKMAAIRQAISTNPYAEAYL